MKEAFEKIKERLEEKKKNAHDMHGKPHMDYGTLVGWESAMMYALDFVSEVEAEYINKSTEHINKSGDCSTGWIPCSERLPDKSGRVLVSYESINDEIAVSETNYDHRRKTFWISPCVIAWMPLPEPWKGDHP